MVDQVGRDALMSVLSGLTQHHRMSLVHITHYNSEAEAADRVINLTGNGGAADNTEMVETAAAPAATVATATTPMRRCSSSTASDTNTPAEHPGRQPLCATSTSRSMKATAC